MPLAIGSRLGPYEVLGVIGAGGMGEVYRAKDSRLSREVALKVLPGEFSTDAERLANACAHALLDAIARMPELPAEMAEAAMIAARL